MVLQKQQFKDDKILIFDEACVYERGEYWRFRMWLAKENKYVRKSLKIKEKILAIERGEGLYTEIARELKRGRKYFSISVKEDVELYVESRTKEVGLGDINIVKGRSDKIQSHLNHFLEHVRKDDKVANLSDNTFVFYERNENETTYLQFRKSQNCADSTIANEVSTINTCINHLYSIRKVSNVARFYLPSN